MNNTISFPNPAQLEQRIRSLEEHLQKLLLSSPQSDREWLTKDEFFEATGIKSYYTINKLKVVAALKQSKFKHKKLNKRLYIHHSEIDRFFEGYYES